MVDNRADYDYIAYRQQTEFHGKFFFVRFTEPFYKITRKLFPFAKESYIPPTAILIIVVLRILLIAFKTAIQYK